MPETTFLLLSQDHPEQIIAYVRQQGWLDDNETVVDIQKAGEGNMNLVLRVVLENRSFILKQSRPWVEKYPQIAAPEERVLVEIAFYESVAPMHLISDRMPALLAVDRVNRVAQLEDLGTSTDYTFVYEDTTGIEGVVPSLCEWLSDLHRNSFSIAVRESLENRAMRTLNHEHIFHFPLVANNQFNLDTITPGLQHVGDSLKQDPVFVSTVTELGIRYLESGHRKRDVLLHGDFYPGSWLDTPSGLRIIDPEFCFFGDAEFDVGVFLAHMVLAGCSDEILTLILDHYDGPSSFTPTLAMQYAGVEIMRRLIGVAQLPRTMNLETKGLLLQEAKRMVLRP